MDGYQFCHVETWSLAGSRGSVHHESGTRKNGQADWTAADILDETERLEGACFHVESGGPAPVLLPGAVASFDGLRAAHAAAAQVKESYSKLDRKTGKTKRQRRTLRRDARSLYTAVFSLPVDAAKACADPILHAKCMTVLQAAVDHERARIESRGGTFMCAVVHSDEGYLHVHLYALDMVLGRVNHLHPGVAAKKAFLDDPRAALIPADQRNRGGDRAYREAMRGWQNELHENVFGPAGLLRIGPRKLRVSRDEWHAAKKAGAEREAGCRDAPPASAPNRRRR